MKNSPAFILITVFILIQQVAIAQEPLTLVPMPVSVKQHAGIFKLDASTVLVLEGSGLDGCAGYFNDHLEKHYGFRLKTGRPETAENAIVLNFERLDHPLPGAYALQVTNKQVYIGGDNETGVFYGLQTLLQLLPSKKGSTLNIPLVDIADHPRFAYRGMHLDVARHFFPIDYVKRFIDFLAYHKFNNFHWHLTDDQGWRLEIKKYPLLTELGSCRAQTQVGRMGNDLYDSTKYCGFYTQEEAREIVAYAAQRYINVIPEIDMPGHFVAALSAYPYLGCTKGPYKVRETWGVAEDVLCAGNDSSYAFVKDVLDEVMSIFPSEYIHIGGDECPKVRWKACPSCQERIKREGLKDEVQLQSYFISEIEKHLNRQKRKMIGWDEILEGGLAPNAIVMSWRGETGGISAAKLNHDAIMTPEKPLYLNFSQTKNEDSVTQGNYNPLEDVYNYEPIPAVLTDSQSNKILGAQANCWSEYISNGEKLEYMIFPRMSALSEVLWTPKSKKNWQGFEERLPALLERYRFQSINYSNAYYDLQPEVSRTDDNEILWKLSSRDKNAKVIYVIDSNTNASFNYEGPIKINRPGLYGAALTNKDHKLTSNWTWQRFSTNLATGSRISLKNEPNKSYSLGGAFSLIDGIQNEKGMLKAYQFLGFNGRDFEASIDLKKRKKVKEIIIHCFEQKISWIYRPAELSIWTSLDGKKYVPVPSNVIIAGTRNLTYSAHVNDQTRYIKIFAKNKGLIGTGEPGAGHNAWLFVDEIEIR